MFEDLVQFKFDCFRYINNNFQYLIAFFICPGHSITIILFIVNALCLLHIDVLTDIHLFNPVVSKCVRSYNHVKYTV